MAAVILEGQLSALDLLIPDPPPAPIVSNQTRIPDLIGFTMSITDPDELDKIHREHVNAYRDHVYPNWLPFRGWSQNMTAVNGGGEHRSYGYTADTRCPHFKSDQKCECIGGYYYRIYCAGCDWWTDIYERENGAAEEYLDHCWKGWRNLPPIETTQKANGGYNFKIPADYPAEWQIPGAPIRGCRGMTKYGTRHVPSGSPWHGYKAAVIQECKNHGDQ